MALSHPLICAIITMFMEDIYYEGSHFCSTNVVYDHAYSAFSQSDVEDYKWEDILEPGDIFYFSGVTPAASYSVCQSLKRALKVL